MKYLIYLGLALFLTSSLALATESMPVAPSTQHQPVIGGWYPVFFDNYDQTKINSIISTIQENRAKRIVVLYDQNTALANQIIASIQSKVNFAIERSQDVPKDTATTKYNHTRVVVTVFLKSKDGAN